MLVGKLSSTCKTRDLPSLGMKVKMTNIYTNMQQANKVRNKTENNKSFILSYHFVANGFIVQLKFMFKG